MSEGELTIDGFELVNCIATGNVSQVWEAREGGSGQSFAMKILLPEAISDNEQKRTMRHEASVMKQFEHPNIVRYVESRVSKKFAYIVMELFRSVNVKTLLRSDLDATHLRLKRLMECTTQSLAYLHEKKWIHKDVKPDNILINKGGEVRVIDFSLASRASSAMGRMMTRKKSIAIQGTRTYIAPELVRRDKMTPSVDIYSLGVVFFEALTGRPPFMGTNPNALLMAHVRERADVPSSYHPNITPEVDALVMRMLNKKPEDRPESMQEVFAEVRSLKFFKQDPEVFKREREAAEKEKLMTGVDQRLDSRADASRTEQFGYRPMPAKPSKAVAAAQQPAAASASQPAPQAGGPPMPPQPMMPQQPMQPPWMQPMPMQPMMYPPMPHQPPGPLVAGGYPQGMPPQPQPSAAPGQPYPPPQQPTQPASPPAQPTAPPAAATPKKEQDLDTPDNLDWLNVS